MIMIADLELYRVFWVVLSHCVYFAVFYIVIR